MNFYLTLAFAFFSICCTAQKADENYAPVQYKSSKCNSSFTKIKIEGDNNSATIRKLLKGINENLKDERCGLQLNYINTSPGGIHYSFTQTFSGISVYQSEIKVNTDKHNIVHSIFDNSYDTRNWTLNTSGVSENAIIAIDPATGLPVIAQRSVLKRSLETLTANGKVIFQQDLNSYAAPHDSIASGLVFNPDPLTTSGHLYDTNTIYKNNNGADAPWLDAQQQSQNLRVTFDSTNFTLVNPFVFATVSFDSFPSIAPVILSRLNFNRSEYNFIDVNAFYHISTYHDYIKSLGFNCADSLITICAHALINEDNSYFSPTENPHQIYFGTGGVPDAEDADVVVHEYCHSVSFTAAPNSNFGGERKALDEAFCDYNAASYSKSLNTFNDEWVYNWDGHNEYWNGRVVNSTKIYPQDLDGSIYHNGEIWSSALFSINGDIGRGITDSLIIQAHYAYAQNISMADAAQLLIDADSIISNGAHYCAIYQRLLQHGFVAPNGLCAATGITERSANSFSFAQYGNGFTVTSTSDAQLHIQLLDVTGRSIATLNEGDHVLNYQNPRLPTGLYLVNITSQQSAATYKWVKAR
ncbi:MAG: hypothetical protein JWO06_3185 [Bacteroidota bacterium]|nr:hypothetical protein [Bacteroidota bacterium]